MHKQQSPAFQFYAQDFLAGTADMTCAEVGAYIRLLCHQWIRKGLSKNNEVLLRLSGAEIDVLFSVRKKFSERKNGLLQNLRLEIERKKQREYSKKQAENARTGWDKRRNATAMPPHHSGIPSGICQNDALQSSSSLPPSPSSFGLIPGGEKTKRNGRERAGLPPPDAVRKFFAEMDPQALAAMPGAAVQKACEFIGMHHKTASRAANRNDISDEFFVSQYADCCADTTLGDPVAVLAARLRLSKPKPLRPAKPTPG